MKAVGWNFVNSTSRSRVSKNSATPARPRRMRYHGTSVASVSVPQSTSSDTLSRIVAMSPRPNAAYICCSFATFSLMLSSSFCGNYGRGSQTDFLRAYRLAVHDSELHDPDRRAALRLGGHAPQARHHVVLVGVAAVPRLPPAGDAERAQVGGPPLVIREELPAVADRRANPRRDEDGREAVHGLACRAM